MLCYLSIDLFKWFWKGVDSSSNVRGSGLKVITSWIMSHVRISVHDSTVLVIVYSIQTHLIPDYNIYSSDWWDRYTLVDRLVTNISQHNCIPLEPNTTKTWPAWLPWKLWKKFNPIEIYVITCCSSFVCLEVCLNKPGAGLLTDKIAGSLIWVEILLLSSQKPSVCQTEIRICLVPKWFTEAKSL